MGDSEPRPTIEPVKPETIRAIIAVIDVKLDNSETVRANKDRGIFVLDYSREHGGRSGPRIELWRADELTSSTLIRFVESFDETTPRHKPSVLVYDYEIKTGVMSLLLEAEDPDEDHGPLAKARRNQLIFEGIKNVPSGECYNLSYKPSESHAQKILASLTAMKTFIE